MIYPNEATMRNSKLYSTNFVLKIVQQ